MAALAIESGSVVKTPLALVVVKVEQVALDVEAAVEGEDAVVAAVAATEQKIVLIEWKVEEWEDFV